MLTVDWECFYHGLLCLFLDGDRGAVIVREVWDGVITGGFDHVGEWEVYLVSGW